MQLFLIPIVFHSQFIGLIFVYGTLGLVIRLLNFYNRSTSYQFRLSQNDSNDNLTEL